MVFDAICFITQYNFADSNSKLLDEQLIFIDTVDALSLGKLHNGAISMSDLCFKLTQLAENIDFENYSLDDLAELFKNLDEFDNEWIERYISYIDILKEIQFDKLWQSDILPFVQDEIIEKEKIYQSLDIDAAIADIQKLKQCEPLGDINIYVSFMSFPVSFKLYGSNFVDCVKGSRGAGIICHELMHGFTNTELENLYLQYINGIEYLREEYDKLINEQLSGNEEEFVAAAEYYLRMKHNGENKAELLTEARRNYRGCMPTSVFLFDLLAKEEKTPNGYAEWLSGVFKSKKLPKKAILRNLDKICPKSPIEIYHDSMFGHLRTMIEAMKEMQQSTIKFDMENELESVTGHTFEDISETIGKTVFFAQERQPLPNAIRVKEIHYDNIYINIAEFESREAALCDGLNDFGTHIGPDVEKINGHWRCLFNANNSCIGKTPMTVSVSFVKDNYRISFTSQCPKRVNRNIDFPSTLKQGNDHILAYQKGMSEAVEIEKAIPPYEEFVLKYSTEILTTHKQLEDIIIKLKGVIK